MRTRRGPRRAERPLYRSAVAIYRLTKYLTYFRADPRSVLEFRSTENIKRITISLDDEIYLSLIDFAAKEARVDMSRLSISRTMQKIMQEKLLELNYYPPKHLDKVPPLLEARGRTVYTSKEQILEKPPMPQIAQVQSGLKTASSFVY